MQPRCQEHARHAHDRDNNLLTHGVDLPISFGCSTNLYFKTSCAGFGQEFPEFGRKTRILEEEFLARIQHEGRPIGVVAQYVSVVTIILMFSVGDFQRISQISARVSASAREERVVQRKLRSAEKSLVRTEKLASVGVLTAGIAHEIQNPLNFVNNFSEVSNELIDEMNEELDKGDLEEVKAISLDIKQNLEKINHHGKRADNIVKGMLQHSRSSSGTKEPTDINALADEYLRLAYHGLRAKDKSFNAELITNFDKNMGKVNIVPQDMGRVILNLITNAFYAVNEKANSDIEGYKPTVKIISKRTPLLGGVGGGSQSVQISISDNGNGIPKEIVEKIFQPFFSTKPTGDGSGLGLSVVQGIVLSHKGTIKAENNKNKGATFTVRLPKS